MSLLRGFMKLCRGILFVFSACFPEGFQSLLRGFSEFSQRGFPKFCRGFLNSCQKVFKKFSESSQKNHTESQSLFKGFLYVFIRFSEPLRKVRGVADTPRRPDCFSDASLFHYSDLLQRCGEFCLGPICQRRFHNENFCVKSKKSKTTHFR